MLIPRLLAALVLIPLVILALYFLPLPYFSALVIVLCGLAAWEWTQFINLKKKMIKVVFAFAFGLVLATFYYLLPESYLFEIFKFLLLISIVWWLIALGLVITYPKAALYWQNSCLIKFLFGLLTICPFFAGMITLRQFNYAYDSYAGANWLLYVLILIWATDSGAYFAGRLFGKHKLAPKVSPGKTIEGFLGGVLTALIITCIVMVCFSHPFPIVTMIVSSFIAILASVLGDLTESMFKRAANIKDSGHLIPGHGGILDRIDSLTAAIPVFSALIFYIL